MLERLQSSGMGQPDRVNGNPFEGLMWGLGIRAFHETPLSLQLYREPSIGFYRIADGPSLAVNRVPGCGGSLHTARRVASISGEYVV